MLASEKTNTSVCISGLHELDSVYRNVTLENERLKSVVRDLRFHKDPVGKPEAIIDPEVQ